MGYEKSKVYKLQHEDGHFYIGSTINELRMRFREHKCKSKTDVKRIVYKHINGEWDNVRIILIEAFECTNRSELLKKENEYIQKELDNPLCLNSRLSYMSEEDYKIKCLNNRDERLKYFNQYYEDNKVMLRQKQAEYRAKNRDKINKQKIESYHNLKTHSE